MARVMAVSFERYGRLYYLDPGEHDYSVGDRVLVPTESGPEVAECVWAPEWVDEDGFSELPVCAGLGRSGAPGAGCGQPPATRRGKVGRQEVDQARTSCR